MLQIQVCSDPPPLHCRAGFGKMHSSLSSAALQNRLTACLCDCNNTCQDLLLILQSFEEGCSPKPHQSMLICQAGCSVKQPCRTYCIKYSGTVSGSVDPYILGNMCLRSNMSRKDNTQSTLPSQFCTQVHDSHVKSSAAASKCRQVAVYAM